MTASPRYAVMSPQYCVIEAMSSEKKALMASESVSIPRVPRCESSSLRRVKPSTDTWQCVRGGAYTQNIDIIMLIEQYAARRAPVIVTTDVGEEHSAFERFEPRRRASGYYARVHTRIA